MSSEQPPTFATGLVGACLAFWGWRTGHLEFAIPAAALVESARVMNLRFAFVDEDFNRLTDLSALLFLALAAYQFDAHSARGIFGVVQLSPLLLLILLLGQTFSVRQSIAYSSLFWSVRRAEARGMLAGHRVVDFRYPFIAVTLLAASTGQRDVGYLIGVLFLAAWTLFPRRPRRYRKAIWLLVFLSTAGLGFVFQNAITGVQRVLHPIFMELIQNRLLNYRDPYQNHTALGSIGELKISDRIVLRVDTRGKPPPPLLREAIYQSFNTGVWMARDTQFEELPQEDGGTSWILPVRGNNLRQVEISRGLNRGRGVLALPTGTTKVRGLNVESAQRNQLGAVKVSTGPDLITYRALYDPTALDQKPPSADDLVLPRRLKEVVVSVADQLALTKDNAGEAIRTLNDWFLRHFRYSLNLDKRNRDMPPVSDFLLNTRTGHCEYFATSTVLLLRAAGIPARYAVGYSIQEYSDLEGLFVARRRHAHSWASAWVGGRWLDVDTTPPDWGEMEEQAARWWWPVYDIFSWLRHGFLKWRLGDNDEQDDLWWLWVIPLLVAVLIWRLARQRKVAPPKKRPAQLRKAIEIPLSSFDQVLTELRGEYRRRRRGETLAAWLNRIPDSTPGVSHVIRELLPAYYQIRFDPGGLPAGQKSVLEVRAKAWLRRFGRTHSTVHERR